MKYGFVKVAASSPKIKVGAPLSNADAIVAEIARLDKLGVEIAVFPELCVTGYTAADLFYTDKLLSGALEAAKLIAAATPENMLVFFGAPLALRGRLYNCAIAASGGRTLGITPKTELPEYGEFYEKRYFTRAFTGTEHYAPLDAPMGDVLYECSADARLVVGCEICEDMWADIPPSVEATRAGATVIVNLSASNEVVGKAEYRRTLVAGASGRQRCAYIYSDAGEGESTTDAVFAAHDMIAENGTVMAESLPFADGCAMTDIDVERLDLDRRRMGMAEPKRTFERISFSLGDGVRLTRAIEKYPFVPTSDGRAELILEMQSHALRSRMDAIGAKTAVIGVSGGLDSALALLVCVRAVGAERVMPVTMPGFGTTDKTLGNADGLCAALGLKMRTVDIRPTVERHLKDIDHSDKDVVFENAQARTRTMTLFDIANKTGGIVVGTGDLSELALGWATYNGDHMSSYGVNAGVPKTLVKRLVRYEAERLGGEAKGALLAILGTDISPELLPSDDGRIAQKTEDILGKYDLIDFIVYYRVRFGFSREKIEFLIKSAFTKTPAAEIKKALDTFYKRFDAAQFKRSCLPDGPKIGSVSFSPRSDFRMPSDARSDERRK